MAEQLRYYALATTEEGEDVIREVSVPPYYFKCDICDEGVSEADLQAHSRLHTSHNTAANANHATPPPTPPPSEEKVYVTKIENGGFTKPLSIPMDYADDTTDKLSSTSERSSMRSEEFMKDEKVEEEQLKWVSDIKPRVSDNSLRLRSQSVESMDSGVGIPVLSPEVCRRPPPPFLYPPPLPIPQEQPVSQADRFQAPKIETVQGPGEGKPVTSSSLYSELELFSVASTPCSFDHLFDDSLTLIKKVENSSHINTRVAGLPTPPPVAPTSQDSYSNMDKLKQIAAASRAFQDGKKPILNNDFDSRNNNYGEMQTQVKHQLPSGYYPASGGTVTQVQVQQAESSSNPFQGVLPSTNNVQNVFSPNLTHNNEYSGNPQPYNTAQNKYPNPHYFNGQTPAVPTITQHQGKMLQGVPQQGTTGYCYPHHLIGNSTVSQSPYRPTVEPQANKTQVSFQAQPHQQQVYSNTPSNNWNLRQMQEMMSSVQSLAQGNSKDRRRRRPRPTNTSSSSSSPDASMPKQCRTNNEYSTSPYNSAPQSYSNQYPQQQHQQQNPTAYDNYQHNNAAYSTQFHPQSNPQPLPPPRYPQQQYQHPQTGYNGASTSQVWSKPPPPYPDQNNYGQVFIPPPAPAPQQCYYPNGSPCRQSNPSNFYRPSEVYPEQLTNTNPIPPSSQLNYGNNLQKDSFKSTPVSHLNNRDAPKTYSPSIDTSTNYVFTVPCNQCDQSFQDETEMHAHMEIIHNIDKHTIVKYCRLCGQGFTDIAELKRHYGSEHKFSGINADDFCVLRCWKCKKQYKKLTSLTNHLWEKHSTLAC